MKLTRYLIPILCFALFPSPLFAEKVVTDRNALLKRLGQKLTGRDGKPVSIVVFSPMDFTSNQVGPLVGDTLARGLKSFGNLSVRQEEHLLANLTLEEFRRAMTEFKVDVLVAAVLKNSNFDLYIYDRRTPYYIYAHSEAIPEVTQLNITPKVATYFGRLILRRSLFRYVNDQYFELPREEYAPVLQSEIPRWIASRKSLAEINREITSRFYLSATTGTAVSLGTDGKLWNSPLLALQIGFRPAWNFYLEASAHSSSYSIVGGAMHWMFQGRKSPFKFGVGLGAYYATNEKVWIQDSAQTLGPESILIAPIGTLLYPIGDIYLKVLVKYMVDITSTGQNMFAFMPGIQIYF